MTDNLKPDIDLIDDALHVPDERSIEMVYRLLDEEGYARTRNILTLDCIWALLAH